MKTIFIFLILLQTILFAQNTALQKVKLQLQWKYQFQFAGFIMAKEMGYYKDVGLDVELIEFREDIDIMGKLQNQELDYALSNTIIPYKDKKLYATTLIATYFQRSPLVLITQPEIDSMLDIHGKKIMISQNEYLNSSLTMLLHYFDISPKENTFITQTYSLDDFITKKIDATTAFRSNELFILDKKGIPYNIIDPIEYGFVTNANNLFTSHTKIKNNPQQVDDFLSATKKGWEYALNNMETTSKIIYDKDSKSKSMEHLMYEAKITKELMILNLFNIGDINKEFVKKTYELLSKSNTIDKTQRPDKLILQNKDLQKWIKQLYVQEAKDDVTRIIMLFLLLIILLILFWSFKMRKEMKKRSVIQEAFKVQRDLNELYLDTAEVLIVVLDVDGKVTMLNKKGEELLEYTEEELLGKVWFDIGVLPKDIAEKIKIFFTNIVDMYELPSTSTEHSLISKSGKEIVLSFRNSLLFDSENNVTGILSSGSDITELLKTQDALKHQAEHDALTGLPNRILYIDRLEQAIKNATRTHESIAVVFIDLDHFKDVNDSLGHGVGDTLLKTVSQQLQDSIRKSDTVARLGGDEFTIILDKFTKIKTITTVMQNIINSFKEPLLIENQEIYVTLSIGISVYPQNGADANTLIKNADAAMYKAKHNGRNNYQFYTQDMTLLAYDRIVLETQLRQSLDKNQMEVYYQLQIDSRDDTVIGMEALIRWNHPEKGFVTPDNFIPLAEEIGFITELDEWGTDQALRQFKKWKEMGLYPGVLSLNLSILRLEKDGFIQSIQDIFNNNLAKPGCFSFEITESQIMKNPQSAIDKLNQLSALGIKLSIDDFGTGYSSLAYLKRLPISKLKIDRSFIKDIPDDLDDIEITKTIISMAKNLNLLVIAEGAETIEQIEFLKAIGCYEIQGYFYHKPAPAIEVEQILKVKQQN